MNLSRPGRAAVVAVAVALGVLGCGRKVTSVDSSFTTPAGTRTDRAKLVVFVDRPVPVLYYADFSPPGVSPSDVLDSTVYMRRATPVTVHGMIFDGTPASGYQVFRREDGGGLAPLDDFVHTPSQRWVDMQWELYSFRDEDPTRSAPPTYQARGLLAGAATARSPLTNPASTAVDTALADIGLDIVYGQPPNTPYIDSLFTVRWNAVPGAAGYYLHVFQFRNDLRDERERILAGTPAPFFEGKTKDIYGAFLPAGVTRHKVGDPDGIIFTRRQTFYGQVYLVRASAVDASGRMIAFTNRSAYRVGPYENGYTLQPLGAIIVSPTRSAIEPQNSASGVRVEAPLTGQPARLIEAGGQRYLQPER